MKRIIKTFAAVCLAVAITALTAAAVMGARLPDEFLVQAGQQLHLNDNIKAGSFQDVSSGKTIRAEKTMGTGGSYKAQLSIFGVIPIKDVNVSVVDSRVVIPCGTPFGIKMFTDGVVVVGMTDVEADQGLCNPAKDAGIKLGDVITQIDGRKISANAEVAELISSSQGSELSVTLKRGQTMIDVSLLPVRAKIDNRYKAGIWVRDSSAGIGTITFYDESSGLFGGLGHPVCDIDTGDILPLMSGEVVDVTITDVAKGVPGLPGELKGSFNSSTVAGSLIVNTDTGLYGMLNSSPSAHEAVPVALKQEIREGRATILSTVDGGDPQEFDIVIEKVNMSDINPTKNLIIRITDQRLLGTTGGI
ncbi:MAG: SpoIVB peptidase S55 domain-containing protein, partial [Acetanaerobacterium sp.]